MAANLGDRKVVGIEEALHMEMIINQALIDLLIEKGIMTEQELIQKIEDIRDTIPDEGIEA